MSTKRVLIISGIAFLLMLVLEIMFVEPHVLYWWHGFMGFDFLFGLIGALILLGLAKGLVNKLVERKEDYYDHGGGEDSHV
ncbi:MAG: hypothetical protein PHX01_02645 [Clostridia bacterium]|nr:hypothetical protein [Clostridia bacterium]